MKIAHLSHTDLDGYSCQFITNFYFKDVAFFNSNYGTEIDEKFNQILEYISDDEAVIIISDLNLTKSQCQNYENAVKNTKAKLLLLDHHQSGQECFENFSWYFLDNSRCATKITYDFFSSIYGKNEILEKYANVVNAVDIWLHEDENFELGKACMNIISNAKEINKILFPNEQIEYFIYLMKTFCSYFDKENSHICLDNDTHKIKKNYFKSDKDDTLSNLLSVYCVKLLEQNKDKFTIFYQGKKGLLTYNIENVSVIGNDFLVANPDFDFFVNITSKKTFSFRANGKIDVAQMAKDLVGGGGHVNASGGFFTNFKDCHDYELIKKQVCELIEKKVN